MRYHLIILSAYKHYLEGIENGISTDPSSFWKFINLKRIPRCLLNESVEVTRPVDIVEAFANVFSSVYTKSDTNVDSKPIKIMFPLAYV